MALIPATTIDRVKSLINKTDTDDDATLTAMVSAVSQQIETYIGRTFDNSSSFTDRLTVHDPSQQEFFLRNYPVASISSFKAANDWDFASATEIDTDLYDLEGDTGQIHTRTYFTPGKRVLRVVYSGGLAADTAGLIAGYPDIAQACDTQVVALWRRRSSPQGKTMTGSGPGSITHEASYNLLPGVIAMLAPYRRERFGV